MTVDRIGLDDRGSVEDLWIQSVGLRCEDMGSHIWINVNGHVLRISKRGKDHRLHVTYEDEQWPAVQS